MLQCFLTVMLRVQAHIQRFHRLYISLVLAPLLFVHAAERRLPLLDVAACQRAPVELCQRLKCRKAGDAAHALYRLNDAVVVAHDEREISKRKTASLLSDADVAQLMQPPCSAPYTASAFSIPLPMPMRFLTCDSCCSGMPVTRSLND